VNYGCAVANWQHRRQIATHHPHDDDFTQHRTARAGPATTQKGAFEMFRPSLLFAAILICWQCVSTRCDGQYYYVEPSYQPAFYAAPQGYYVPQMEVQHEASASAQPESHSGNIRSTGEANVPSDRQTAFRNYVQRTLAKAESHASIPAKQVGFQQAYGQQPYAETIPAPPTGEYQPLASPESFTHPAPNCLPDCREGALHILKYPGILGQIDCCPDNSTGNCDCDIQRFDCKEEALKCCHDPNCVICVQEPYICEKLCYEEAEVVFFRCYEKCEPFKFSRCEDQRCIQEVGKRTVKKLDPCTVKIKVPIRKLVIEYRKVWICINCPLPECKQPMGAGYDGGA
jgi:hypothetical protein